MSNNNTEKYVGAPYNFVPFYNDVVKVEQKQMETHDKIEEGLLTGEISYSITAVTPIFISDGKKDGTKDVSRFARNERGEYIIPGSSMRGLIRSNAQVLGLSSFNDDINDYNLMYRKVASNKKGDRYQEVLGAKPVSISVGDAKKPINVLTNVKAGYIAKKGKDYIIYKTDVDTISKSLGKMNYYVLSERYICEDMKRGKTSFPYFKNHPECLENDMNKGFQKEEKKGRIHYKGKESKLYKENYSNISYNVADLRHIVAVGEPGQYSKEGCLVCSGKMNEKKAKYIIPRINKEKEYITIPKEDVEAFQIDYNRKKNTLRGNKDFFALPKEGEIKPVFYIELDGRLYFGFTPRLRIFYKYNIKAGLLQKNPDFDYAKSLFGTVHKKVGYKSKVAFTDALLVGAYKEAKEEKVILGEPKPTSYLDYLKQTDRNTTYNTKGFELRGMKQYWLHKPDDPDDPIKVNNFTAKNDNVYSHIRALDKGSVFKGVVRFQNLTKAELGLLLWSICLKDNSWMNIGKAKALGFGVIDVNDVMLRLFDIKKAYNLEPMIDFNPISEVAYKEYIDAYKVEINSKIKEGDIEKLESIQTFFDLHDRNLIPDNKMIRYMSIDKNEFQSRDKALPSVKEVINNSKSHTSASRPKIKIVKGNVYTAEIKDYQGKKVKFYIEGGYYPIPVENITGIENLNKNNMKEKLPKGTKVSVKCLSEGAEYSFKVI